MIATWYRQVYNVMVISAFIKKQIKLWAQDDNVKQADTFTLQQVQRFLNDAPNEICPVKFMLICE
jgi:hypothetical protein